PASALAADPAELHHPAWVRRAASLDRGWTRRRLPGRDGRRAVRYRASARLQSGGRGLRHPVRLQSPLSLQDGLCRGGVYRAAALRREGPLVLPHGGLADEAEDGGAVPLSGRADQGHAARRGRQLDKIAREAEG